MNPDRVALAILEYVHHQNGEPCPINTIAALVSLTRQQTTRRIMDLMRLGWLTLDFEDASGLVLTLPAARILARHHRSRNRDMPAIRPYARPEAAAIDLSSLELDILEVLEHAEPEGATIPDLVETCRASRDAIRARIEKLQDLGWIRRAPFAEAQHIAQIGADALELMAVGIEPLEPNPFGVPIPHHAA